MFKRLAWVRIAPPISAGLTPHALAARAPAAVVGAGLVAGRGKGASLASSAFIILELRRQDDNKGGDFSGPTAGPWFSTPLPSEPRPIILPARLSARERIERLTP